MRRALLLIVLPSLVAAGCLAPAADPLAPSDGVLPDLTDLIVVDHDHADPALHTARTDNLVRVGFTDLALDAPTGANTASDVVDGWAVVGLAQHTSGFALVDVSDPTAPTTVSHFYAPNTFASDVKFDEEASLLFLATQWIGDPTSTSTALGHDLTRATQGPTVYGVYVVDVSDKTAPRLESVLPIPGGRGAHTVHYHLIGGEPYVLVTTYTFPPALASAYLPGGARDNPVPVTQRLVITKLETGPDGKRHLTPVSEYSRFLDPGILTGANGRTFPHEVSVSESPVDGKTYAWLSYWDLGLVVLDLSDPAEPRLAGEWRDFDPNDGGLHYSATFPELIHGRQITIAGPEFQTHEYSGRWWALDTTDLSDIKTLGWWTLPGAPPIEQNYRYSPHNFDLYGTLVIGANYHGGLFVWDVERLVRHFAGNASSEPMETSFRVPLGEALHGESDQAGHGDVVDVVGYYIVAEQARASIFGGESPYYWNALLRDGHIYISDIEAGFLVLRYTDLPADATGMLLKGHAGHHR